VADPDSPTFKAAVVKWAEEVLPKSVKPAVMRRYLTSIAQLDPVFGPLRIGEVNTAKISEYVSLRTRTTSNATIRRDLTALSRLMAACVAWGWRDDNPVRLYDRSVVLRERREPIEPPGEDDFQRVLAAVPEAMAKVLRLLDQTGMRENEAVVLTASDVNKERKQITLLRTKTSRPRTLDWKTPAGDATDALTAGEEKGVLFPSRSGKPYGNFASAFGAVMRRVVAAEKKAKRPFRRFRVHDLRHGFAIRWLKNGGGIYELSKHLGHSSVKTTEGYLGYLSGKEQKLAQTGAQWHVGLAAAE
jgi:integrase